MGALLAACCSGGDDVDRRGDLGSSLIASRERDIASRLEPQPTNREEAVHQPALPTAAARDETSSVAPADHAQRRYEHRCEREGVDAVLSALQRERVEKIFAKMDTGGDGIVDSADLALIRVDAASAMQVFAAYDSDSVPSSIDTGALSRIEFVTMVNSLVIADVASGGESKEAAAEARVVAWETAVEQYVASAGSAILSSTPTVAAEPAALSAESAAGTAAAPAEDSSFLMGGSATGGGVSGTEEEILAAMSPEERDAFLEEKAAKELHEKRKMKNLARTMKSSGAGNPLKKKRTRRKKKR
jgi:hypothetical protein